MKNKRLINTIKKNEKFIVFALLLILTLQNVLSSFYISPTADELKHVVRGYVYLKTGDLRFNIGQPLLINSLNAVPLLFIKGIHLPLGHESWKNTKLIDFAFQFFFHSGNDLERIFSLARITTFVLSIILGIFVYVWAKKLYGAPSGLFALSLYVLSPNVIAFSGLATNDVGSALLIFLSIFAIWLFYKNPTIKRLLLSGFMFGLALMGKYYAPFFMPSIVILLIIASCNNKSQVMFLRPKKNARISRLIDVLLVIIIFFLASWLTINIFYGFNGTFRSIERNLMYDSGADKEIYIKFTEKAASYVPLANREGSLRVVKYVASNIPTMLPYYYVKGIIVLKDIQSERGNKQFYFFSSIHQKPPKYYYFTMFFLKEQVPMLMFLALTIIFYRKIKKNCIDDCFLLIPALTFLILFSIIPIANGFRHMLPILPLLYVFSSKLANVKVKYRTLLNCSLIILMIGYTITPIRIFPHYLPYYNEFIGMDNGYKVSINVDVDWGQDLKLLKRYMDEKGIRHIGLSYFGQVYPEYYNISYTYLPSVGTFKYKGTTTPLNEIEDCKPYNGIVAISIANLKQPFYFKNESCFDWLKGLKPIGRAGYTIYVFNSSS